MKMSSCLAAIVAGAFGVHAWGQSVTTAFTYQGELTASGVPANGVYDFRFSLYTESGTPVGTTLCVDNLTVENGRFTSALDFGAVFDGTKRFLQIAVRPDTGWDCSNGTGLVLLSPRQELTAAPYAVTALAAGTAANALSLNGQNAGFYQSAANLTSGTLGSGRLSGAYGNAVTFGNAGNSFTGSGAGLTGLNAANLSTGTIAEARLPAGIARLATGQTFSGINTFTANHTFFNGIGVRTLTPQAVLHVLASPSGVTAFSPRTTAILESSQANYLQIVAPVGQERGIGFGDPEHGFKGGIFFDGPGGTAGMMNFRTGTNDTRLVINSAGLVGIGTTTPAALLHVAGAARIDGTITIPATTRHLSIGPGDLQFESPDDEALGYRRQTGFFRSLASGSTQMDVIAPVQLPHGATITEFRVFVRDASCSADARFALVKSLLNGSSATTVATVLSLGCTGIVTTHTQAASHVVDTQNATYSISVRLPASIDIVGMRIQYEVTSLVP